MMQGMYALFVTSREMYLCRDDYSSWLSRSVPCSCPLKMTRLPAASLSCLQVPCAGCGVSCMARHACCTAALLLETALCLSLRAQILRA